jgi:general secretion pathway protein D
MRGWRILTVLAWALLVAGCASGAGTSLFDQLRTADLSAKHPQTTKQGTTPKETERPLEIFPGDDGFRKGGAPEGLTRVSRAGGLDASGAKHVGDGYKLNFDNASLADVTKIILGDTLKVSYQYDQRVQGQVTLATGGSVTREELLSVLENALKMNNALLVKTDRGYRISPASEAVGTVAAVSYDKTEAPGYGVSVLPLRHVSAEAILRLLENFVSNGGSLKAETTGNLLLIRGTSRERQSLMEMAASFDVDWLKGQSAGIFPLAHSTPDELIADLSQVMNTEGDLLSKMVRLQPLHRQNAVLVLARQSTQLQQARDWIRRLDRADEAGQDLHVYRVENGRAQDLAGLLNETLGITGSRSRRRSEVAPGRDVASLATKKAAFPGRKAPLSTSEQQSQQLGARLGPGPARTVDPGVSPGPVSPVGMAPDAPAPPPIRITADEVNNLLLINARPADYRRITNVLRQIDRPPLQVMINATIVEVTLNDTLRYGVQVFLKGKNLSGGVVASTDLPLLPSNPGLNLIVGSLTDPKVVLDALSEVTEVKVVSSPSVVVVDNQAALLKVGDEVPVSTQQATILENPSAPIVSSVQFRDTGVILNVIPRVNSTGLVTMDIEQEISAVVSQPGGPTLTPTISQRQVASTVSVYSGQMVAMGGLISEQRNVDKSGLPMVGQIPIVGELLGHNAKGVKRTELIVFIRPQVIRNSRDARDVAEELRSRLKSLAPVPPSDKPWRTDEVDSRR